MFKTHSHRMRVFAAIMTLALPAMLYAQAATTAPATATAPALPPDPMAILNAVPGDATGFLVLRNLKELNGDLVGLVGTLGFPMGPNGLFPAPLDWIKEMAGIQEGLDETGSLAFVLLNCSQVKTNDEVAQQLVLYIPTNDAQALLAVLGGQKDQDIYAVNLAGQASVAAPKGRFLVVSQNIEALRAALKAPKGINQTMSPNRVEAYASQDLFGWADLRGFSKELRDGIKNTFLGLMAMGDPTAAKQGEQSVQQIEKFVDQSQEVSFGLALDRRGVNLSFFFRMDPESSLGAEMKASKAPAGPLLIGLPDEPTIFAAGGTVSQGEQPELPQALDALLGSEPFTTYLTPEQSTAIKDHLIRLVSDVDLMSVSVANLPTEAKLGLFSVVLVAQVKDSDAYMQQSHKLVDVIKDVVVKAIGGEPAGEQATQPSPAQAVADAFQWKTKAEQVAGVPVDHLVFDLAAIPEATPEDTQKIKDVIGPDGLLVRLAPVDKTHVVCVFGGGAERLTRVIDHIKKGESPLAAGGIQTISKRLPAGPRLMEGYLHIDQLLKLITTIVTQLGQPMPVPLVMRNPAPIAFCVIRVDDAAQEIHVVLPTEMMLSVKEAIAPLMQMFMGGGVQGDMDMEMPPPTPAPESGVN